jgi:RNA polymerase sigma-70 factor (ECF subfamily)
MQTANALTTTFEALPDEDVVRRVIDGDGALFELLIRRHNQRIYRTVRAILRDDDGVEDVMQQAYLNAYAHLHQFAGGAQFSTWLTRIAMNEALGRRRGREHAFTLSDEEVIMNAESRTADPEHAAANAELRDMLEREVAALPVTYRVVLVMRDVEGMSTAETAACLDISADTVKTRLHRGRTMLRDNLARRAGVTLASAFPFGNARCDRVVANVMDAIARM